MNFLAIPVCLEGAKQFLDTNKFIDFKQDVVPDVVCMFF